MERRPWHVERKDHPGRCDTKENNPHLEGQMCYDL